MTFPSCGEDCGNVERPYLHSVAETIGATRGEEPDGSAEFALSPAQLARQLKVKPLASAPLGAIILPQIRPEGRGFAAERLEPAEVSAQIWANLYGQPSGRHEPTLFEEVDGGKSALPRSLADALSAAAPGYRLILGRDAYSAPDFAVRLLDTVAAVTISGPPEVPRDIREALERHGLRPRRIELVSPLRERKGMRLAYRVDADDRHRVKVRHFETQEGARRHFELRADLEAAFTRVLASYGSVLIEEWVEGVPLTEPDSDSRAEEAGALLGRLHARPMGPDLPSMISTRKWSEGAESDLAILTSAGALAPEEAARLRAELCRRDPQLARAALIHLDFCAENMLIDTHGKLRVIDNELIAINPVGLDLGRTFHRWPMTDATWRRFLRGYRAAAPGEPQATGFWKIAAALTGTRVFLQRMPQRVEASVALLGRLTAGEGLADPPP